MNDDENIVLEEIEKKSSHNKDDIYVSPKGKTSYKKRKILFKKKDKNKKLTKKQIAIRTIIYIAIFFLLLVIGVLSTYFIMRQKGKSSFLRNNNDAKIETIDDAKSDDDGQTVIYKGETYKFNKNIASIVLLGIDQDELGTTTYGEAGQADAIYIFAYDTITKKSSIIPVSRETITDIDIYSTTGSYIGSESKQICLSYAYGEGKKFSCNNTLKSLSRLFYNIPFSSYISINWNVIAPLNDAIDGVNVTPLENIKSNETGIVKDSPIKLMGENAFLYVKYRDYLNSNTNIDRLARQKQYINSYINKLIPIAKSDIGIISDLYGISKDYMYTNVTKSQVVYIASSILPSMYTSKDIYFANIKGKTTTSNEHDEFHVNKKSLYETILKVFYTKQ